MIYFQVFGVKKTVYNYVLKYRLVNDVKITVRTNYFKRIEFILNVSNTYYKHYHKWYTCGVVHKKRGIYMLLYYNGANIFSTFNG